MAAGFLGSLLSMLFYLGLKVLDVFCTKLSVFLFMKANIAAMLGIISILGTGIHNPSSLESS